MCPLLKSLRLSPCALLSIKHSLYWRLLLVGNRWRCVAWLGICIGTCRFLVFGCFPSILMMCQIFSMTFMKFSAKPLASGSSGVTTVVLILAHFMQVLYSWLSLPLKEDLHLFSLCLGSLVRKILCRGVGWLHGPQCWIQLDLWVLGVFINCNKHVFSTRQWSAEVHVNLLPRAVR